MNLIRPNSRIQFTAEDMNFIVSALDLRVDSSNKIAELISDVESFDIMLDDQRIVRAVLENPNYLKISTHFYFYILVRHVLKGAGIDNRTLSDYIAQLLALYANGRRSQQIVGSERFKVEYLTDIIASMENVDDKMRFYLQVFIGNYTLFLAGMFPGHIRYRNQYKAAPKIEYYEQLGKSNLGAALY